MMETREHFRAQGIEREMGSISRKCCKSGFACRRLLTQVKLRFGKAVRVPRGPEEQCCCQQPVQHDLAALEDEDEAAGQHSTL